MEPAPKKKEVEDKMISTNIGASVKVVAGFSPQAAVAGAINGAAIDRLGFRSAVLHARSGAVTGAPTAQTYDVKLQDSADGSTGWADIPGAAITQITAANAEAEKDINLAGAKRYIRVVGTVGFTGGTSPTLQVASALVLGGPAAEPV